MIENWKDIKGFEGIFYDCAQDAAKAKGYLFSTLHNWLNGHRPNKTGLIYA